MFEKFDFDLINNERNSSTALVVMMCGIAGSGKTTFAKILENKGFVRLSIDEEIWNTNGRWGIDFPMERFEEYRQNAEKKLQARLISLIGEKTDVVVDFSFWDRKRRKQYKHLIEDSGGKWKLIYLKVRTEDLHERLKLRNKRFDANSFPISEEVLKSYLNGFEEPKDEGEILVEN